MPAKESFSSSDPEELAKAKKEAEDARKKAVDSLMNVFHQIDPTTSGNTTLRPKVEKVVDAIITATGKRLAYKLMEVQ
jgi:hypothetical protein